MQSPLRNVRKAHGFTLQHVAAGVQVNPATLSRIERLEQIPSNCTRWVLSVVRRDRGYPNIRYDIYCCYLQVMKNVLFYYFFCMCRLILNTHQSAHLLL